MQPNPAPSSGSFHWRGTRRKWGLSLWDTATFIRVTATNYSPRALQGFLSKQMCKESPAFNSVRIMNRRNSRQAWEEFQFPENSSSCRNNPGCTSQREGNGSSVAAPSVAPSASLPVTRQIHNKISLQERENTFGTMLNEVREKKPTGNASGTETKMF